MLKIVTCCALLIVMLFANAASAETVRGDLSTRYADVPTIEQDGVVYRLRDRLTAILCMGIDQLSSKEIAAGNYRDGGQADFLLLLVLDDNRKTITPIQINRDTMAKITVINVMGQVSGSRVAQICLAHAFGDGKEQSCALTVSAVSALMLDVPIDYYAAVHMDGIAAFNDALGGVTVTLADDFSQFDAAMTAGATLRLQGAQAEFFVRGRYGVGDQTNTSRMARQQAYIAAIRPILAQKIGASVNYIGTLFDAMEPYLVTDMRRGLMINLAAKADRYDVLPLVQIAGESSMTEQGFMAFTPASGAIARVVVDTFYQPLEGATPAPK